MKNKFSNLQIGCTIFTFQASNSFVTPPLMNCTRFHALKPSIQCIVQENNHLWKKGNIAILEKHALCIFSFLEPWTCSFCTNQASKPEQNMFKASHYPTRSEPCIKKSFLTLASKTRNVARHVILYF